MSSTLDDNNTCETPEQNRGSAVTDAIRAFTDSFGVSNDDEEPNPSAHATLSLHLINYHNLL
jgi:hypothetical protein